MKKEVAIFGGGPSSLALASFLDPSLFKVTIYEQNKTCGRKFLVAGKGGFNLTYSEPPDDFKRRYLPTSFLDKALNHFTNEDFRSWLADLGVETFVGTSNRVFPIKGIKPIEVLDAILKDVKSKGVEIKYQMKWDGWSDSGFPLVNEKTEVKANYYVYAFGGGSWKITGSTGEWAHHFLERGIDINEFDPSNCAFEVDWSDKILAILEGMPLKNIAVSCGGQIQKGELVITRFGLEGNGIYALSNKIRKQLDFSGKALIFIDLKPMFSSEDIKSKLRKSSSKNTTEFLKKDLNLSKVKIQFIKNLTTKEEFINREKLIGMIKNLPINILGTAPIDEAISTVGGLPVVELKQYFELKNLKNSFCIGEMVDWDAPTGGYLLQGCFSMGVLLADRLNEKGKD